MTDQKETRRPNRRGKGEGSIIFRDGKFIGVLSLGIDASGKRLRRWVRGDSKREVQDELTRLKGKQLDGTLTTVAKMTVSEYLKHWIDNVAPQCCRQTTCDNYKKYIRLYIDSTIGGVQLSKLTFAHVQLVHGQMADLSAGSRRTVHATLRRALECAVKARVIPVNVCDQVERPGSDDGGEINFLTPDQAAAFLHEAKSDRLYALYVLAITTGMRQGELFGLKREDFDLEAGVVSVKRTLVRVKGSFVEHPPKTKRGARQISLPDFAVTAMRAYLRCMMAEGNAGSTYVFCTPRGRPLYRTNLRRQSFHPILKRAGCPVVGLHALRHTSATLLLSAGANPKIVQERLGHSSISITMDVYSHSIVGLDKAAAGTFDALLVSQRRLAVAEAAG